MARRSNRRPLPDSSIVKLKVKLHTGASSKKDEDAGAALHALLDDNYAGLNYLIREAIVRSLFRAYAIRFAARTNRMKKLFHAPTSTSPITKARILLKLNAVNAEIAKAGGELKASQRLRDQRDRYVAAYAQRKLQKQEEKTSRRRILGESDDDGAGFGDDDSTEKKLKKLSGGFGARMQDVINRFRDESRMKKNAARGQLAVSFGNIKYMSQVHSSNRTKSKLNTLWRQLEFGSGIFAKQPGNRIQVPNKVDFNGSRMKRNPLTGRLQRLTDGSWILGNADHHGLHILGSQPGNWLRKQTGEAYTEDAQLFRTIFTSELQTALLRRR